MILQDLLFLSHIDQKLQQRLSIVKYMEKNTGAPKC